MTAILAKLYIVFPQLRCTCLDCGQESFFSFFVMLQSNATFPAQWVDAELLVINSTTILLPNSVSSLCMVVARVTTTGLIAQSNATMNVSNPRNQVGYYYYYYYKIFN